MEGFFFFFFSFFFLDLNLNPHYPGLDYCFFFPPPRCEPQFLRGYLLLSDIFWLSIEVSVFFAGTVLLGMHPFHLFLSFFFFLDLLSGKKEFKVMRNPQELLVSN